jgi:hypothetical protein
VIIRYRGLRNNAAPNPTITPTQMLPIVSFQYFTVPAVPRKSLKIRTVMFS